jgi:hypothetical protein
MSAPFPAKKISAILPRLGSNHDGEVVATARALERTLRACGRDWHDLVRVIEGAPEGAPQRKLDWRGQCCEILAHGCTRRENDFCRKLLKDWRGELTEKQTSCLQRIYQLRVASFRKRRA